MIEIEIPGKEKILLKYAFFDLNGTLSVNGIIKSSTIDLLKELSKKLKIFIITADTFGVADKLFKNVDVDLIKLKTDNGIQGKYDIIKKYKPENIISFGNGFNDKLMLANSKIGIIVLQEEGICIETLKYADIMVKDIDDGINLILNPKRLIATLRR